MVQYLIIWCGGMIIFTIIKLFQSSWKYAWIIPSRSVENLKSKL